MAVRMQGKQGWNRDRIGSAIGVAAIHAAVGYLLIVGTGTMTIRDPTPTLKVFDVVEAPPPLPPIEEPEPAPAQAEVEEGAAAPPGLKAQPAQVVVPAPKVRLPLPTPPIVAVPVAGVGAAPSAGASEIAGPGPGAGGVGTGTGSGSEGAGGGGVVSRARLVGGRMVHNDYPDAAGDAGAEGTVVIRLNVDADGRASGCRVTSSSGNADLDATTCRLAEQRFRYEPARDARGQAVADVAGWSQDWWIGARKRR